MTKKIHTLSGCAVLRSLSMLLMVVACVATMQANTNVSVRHQEGLFAGHHKESNKIGGYQQQAVHEDWNVVYATDGQQFKFVYRATAFYEYVRWYDYKTDLTMSGLEWSGERYYSDGWKTGKAVNHTGDNGLILLNLGARDNESRWYATYTYTSGNKIIACDQSAYSDYTNVDKNNSTFEEPTLSQRLIYDIHPASDIAEDVDAATGNKWLEEHDMIAPAGATIHIGPKYAYKGTVGEYPYPNYYRRSSNPVALAGGNWTWKKSINGAAATTINNPTVTSNQFLEVNESNTVAGKDVVYTLQCASGNITYNIAKITVHYKSYAEVGPSATVDTAFMTSAKLLAKQDFNFSGDTVGKTITVTDTIRFYKKPLSVEESTFGFYYGENAKHPRSANANWNEYHLVNYGNGYNNNHSKKFSNRYYNGMDVSKGFVLYTDGSQKPGTVFSINFEAKLCPGAKMYFSAWVGEYALVDRGSHAILDFIVLGVDGDGNETTLTTFTTGEFTSDCGTAWQRVLFPLNYSSDIDFTSYRLRVVNKAKTTSDNDFFIDDAFIYLMPSAIEPVQAATPNECLTDQSPLVMYTRLDYAQMLLTPSAGTTPYFYRWVDKELADDEVATSNHVVPATYYGTPADTRYGMVEVSNQFDNITGSDYTVFNGTFAEFQDQVNDQLKTDPTAFVPQVVYIKENNLEGATPKDRYVAYIVTKMAKINGAYSNYYTCEVANSQQELGTAGKCATRKGSPVAFGVGISSSVDGSVKGQQKPVCANFAYDLTYKVNFAYIDNGKVVQDSSAYVSHWLFGNKAAVEANRALYGNYTFEQIQEALKNYKPSAPATDPNTVIVNRLVNNGVLTLCQYGTGADVDKVLETESNITYVVMPIAGEKSLTFTAFPVARIHPKAPSCTLPQSITLEFKGNGEGDEDIVHRDVMTFVKSYTEKVPAFVATRPRRVRVPYYTYNASGVRAQVDSKAVLVNLSNPEKEYILGEKIYLYSTDDKDLTPSATAPFEAVTISADKQITQTSETNPVAITFTGLSNLKEGHTYTFKVLYTPKTEGENATQEEIDAYCGGADPNDPTKLRPGEAYITFIMVPDLINYVGQENGSWNDDYSYAFTSDGKTYYVAPSEYTSVVFAQGNHILCNPVVIEGEKDIQEKGEDRAVDSKALPYITYDIDYNPYTARNIYVPANTAVVGHANIKEQGTYTFDMPVTAGKWTMTAMPVQGIVSGDIFVPASGEGDINYENGKFAVKNIKQVGGTEAVDREKYSFYNSLFNKEVYNAEQSGSGIDNKYYDITTSTWSFATNSLNTSFGAGYGWALGYDAPATADAVVMRLPKNESEYHYFRNDTWLELKEARLNREGTLGKPAFTGNTTLTLENNEAGNVFVLGNPTFAYIDLTKLAAANDNITGTFYLSGLDKGSRYDHVTGQALADDWYTTDGKAAQYLAPMHAVLVVKSGDASKTLNIKLNADMLVTEDGSKEGDIKAAPAEGDEAPASAPRRVMAAQDKMIYIAAETASFSSTALLVESELASDEALQGEDAEAFLLDQAKTPFAVYTVADGKALAINRIADQTIVPLGFFAQKTVLSEELSFSGADSYLAEWDLVDNQTGIREPLSDGFTTTLSMNNAGTIRYYLEHTRKGISGQATGNDAISNSLNAYTRDGQLTVYSADDMTDFCLYDAAGRTIATSKNAGRMAQFNLANGVYVVRTSGDVLKVIVK